MGFSRELPGRKSNDSYLGTGPQRHFKPVLSPPEATRLLVFTAVCGAIGFQDCHGAGEEEMGLRHVKMQQSSQFLLRVGLFFF